MGTLLGGLPEGERLRVAGTLHARRRPGTYQVLDPGQATLLRTLVDAIIPPTDTPGAGDVGVVEFIDLLLADWYTAEERRDLLAGVARIEQTAAAAGGSLAELPADARTRVLTDLDGARGPLESAAGAFGRIKSLTVYGYFTSRDVQTRVLETVIIPGRYDGCTVPER